MQYKKCSKCLEIRATDQFNLRKASKDGLAYICKFCNKKLCKKFHSENREENKIKQMNYRKNNKQKIADWFKNWQKNNREDVNRRSREWVQANKEKSKKSKLRYLKSNPEKHCFNQGKRRCSKIQRTPKWLTKFDLDYIKNIYIQSKELERLDGVKRHVDHIIPLQGKDVCGLHVPWNLQILTATENIKKNNKIREL